ncbi:MAG: hypothetical protein L6Q72_05945 [Burkholderiaceae bacterium]|nr:hypothetical protein [Burkholderiaceae bacterium]
MVLPYVNVLAYAHRRDTDLVPDAYFAALAIEGLRVDHDRPRFQPFCRPALAQPAVAPPNEGAS